MICLFLIISDCRQDIHPRRLMLDIFPRITGGSPLLYHYNNEKLRYIRPKRHNPTKYVDIWEKFQVACE